MRWEPSKPLSDTGNLASTTCPHHSPRADPGAAAQGEPRPLQRDGLSSTRRQLLEDPKKAHSRAPTSRSAGALGPLAQPGLRRPPQPTAVDARAHRRCSPGDDSLSASRPPPVVGPFTGSDLSSAGTPTDVLGPAEDLAPSGNCDASAVRAAQDEEGSFAGGTRARLHQAAPLTGGCDAAVVAAGQDSLEVGAAVAPLSRKELLR